HLGYALGDNRNHQLAIKTNRHTLSAGSCDDLRICGNFTDNVKLFKMDFPERDLSRTGLYYDADQLRDTLLKVHADLYYQTVDRLFSNQLHIANAPPPPAPTVNVTSLSLSDDRNINYGGTLQADLSLHDNHYTIVGVQFLMDDLSTDKTS